MNKNFIQVTNGLLPITMLILLMAALVVGQSRANLPAEATAVAEPFVTLSSDAIVSQEMLRKIEALPGIVDTLLMLPAGKETHNGVPITPHNKSTHRPLLR